MPQMNKGGKFIFGKSLIKDDYSINFPIQAINEYNITQENKIIIFTGSKSTGSFCVTSKRLLEKSLLKNILIENPSLNNYELIEGDLIHYKGRYYTWISITKDGMIRLPFKTAKFLDIKPGNTLLSIRSSNIAFTMGAKGPLIEKSNNYTGKIEVF